MNDYIYVANMIEIRNFFFIFLVSMLLLIILTWLFTGIFTDEWEWDNNGANALFDTSVDLPDPEGPTSATCSPGSTVRDMPWRTSWPS